MPRLIDTKINRSVAPHIFDHKKLFNCVSAREIGFLAKQAGEALAEVCLGHANLASDMSIELRKFLGGNSQFFVLA